MPRQHPALPGPWCFERTTQLETCALIQSVEYLIEQKYRRFADECAGHQCEAALTVRERQHVPLSHAPEGEALQHALDTRALTARRPRERNVFIEEPGRDDLLDCQVPSIAHVLVLPLGTDVRNRFLAAGRLCARLVP